jgi:hypothetical protein
MCSFDVETVNRCGNKERDENISLKATKQRQVPGMLAKPHAVITDQIFCVILLNRHLTVGQLQ